MEIRRGSEEQAVQYARKDSDLVIEKYEETPVPKRLRVSDTAEEVCDMVEQGRTMQEIYRAHRRFYFFHRQHILRIKRDVEHWTVDPSGHAPDV